jgi:arginase
MLNIYCYNSAAGQVKNGVQYGPKFIINKLTDIGINCNILYSTIEREPRKDNCVNFNVISQDCESLYKAVLNSNIKNALFLGGDHSMSIGSITAMLQKYPNLFVIWIDAHADINTSETSISKNIHGMPLSQLTGIETTKFEWIPKYLNFDKLIYFGIRDLDDAEKEFLKKYDIKSFTVSDIQKFGTQFIVSQILEIIKDNPVHISFDVDSIDPKYIDSTGTLSDNGLELDNVRYLIECLNNIISVDIVEFNPLLGNPEKSINNLMDVITE